MTRKITSVLLALALLIACIPVAMAEGGTLTLPRTGISVTEKFKLDAALLVSMSDGSALPSDLKFSIKTTKIASVNKNGMVTGKKPGSTKLTVSSKSLGLSASCAVTVAANVYIEKRSVEEILRAMRGPEALIDGVFRIDRKMYFKNGKLTSNIVIYNYLGYDLTKIYSTFWDVCDRETESIISRVRIPVVMKKRLKDRGEFKLTITFPKKGLDKVIDLTKLASDGYPAQIIPDYYITWYPGEPEGFGDD